MRDDKAIASWNGLALAALAEAGRRLERADWLDAARAARRVPARAALDADGPPRTARTATASRKGTGFLDDYADVAHGLYELHVATGELRWLEESRRLALLAVELFADDERGGFFLTPADGEQLVARKKDLDDHPIAVRQLDARLRAAAARADLRRRRARAARGRRPAPARRRASAAAPSAFGWALCALDLHLAPPRELAIVGPPDDEVARAALAPFEPNAVVAFGPAEGVPLLEGKELVDGKPAVYVCERFACQAPVTEAEPGPARPPDRAALRVRAWPCSRSST